MEKYLITNNVDLAVANEKIKLAKNMRLLNNV